MFELSIDAGLELLDRRIKFQHLPVSHICIVQSLCRMLGAILVFMESNGGFGEANLVRNNPSFNEILLNNFFINSAMLINISEVLC